MKLAAAALALAVTLGCSGTSIVLPTFELPSFDAAAIQRLVDDALAEVDQLADSADIELPPDLARVLDENNIRLPQLPSNSSDICRALGTPGVGTLAAAGLKELVEAIAAGTEVGLVIGVLVIVVVQTCPIWEPHLTNAVEDLL